MSVTAAPPISTTEVRVEPRASWTPMLIIALAQVLMVFNVSTLQVSIDGIASTFNAPATSVGTAIVTYSLVVAGLIMLGARIAQVFGSRLVFRFAVALFGVAMAVMALSPGVTSMLVAQVIAGIAAAGLVPALVVMVADHYSGHQKAKALGWLGGAQPLGVVLAFLVAGYLATTVGWRFTFGGLVLVAAVVCALSGRLNARETPAGVSIDGVGIVLAASAILLISVGANYLADWGGLLAKPDAPFSVLDMSPAPMMVIVGLFLFEAFVTWSRRRAAQAKTPLVELEVVESRAARSAVFSLFTIGLIGSALTFLVPLYIQVVQGGSGLETAAAVIPFALASFTSAVLVIGLYRVASPRLIARGAFLVTTVALVLLAAAIRQDWGDALVVIGMVVAGLGEGALVALLFTVLVSASPKELAGDVGSLRGCTNNLAAGVGTAVAAALVVSVLGTSVHRNLVHNPLIPDELKAEFNLNDVPFVSNDRLLEALADTSATAEQVTEAVRINTESRLIALKISFFTLAGFALLAFFPAGALPREVHTESREEENAAAAAVGEST